MTWSAHAAFTKEIARPLREFHERSPAAVDAIYGVRIDAASPIFITASKSRRGCVGYIDIGDAAFAGAPADR